MPLSFSFSFFNLLLPPLILVILGCTTWPSVEASNVRCIKREALALLDFKKSFTSTYLGNDKILSWNGPEEDCCEWYGIKCSYHTGSIVSLDLSYEFMMSYQLRPSLLELHHLRRLDLSLNDFSMRIPEFIGSFSKLTYLNLSHAGFFGKVPPHLGNLSRLQTLVLSTQERSLYCEDSRWISTLSSLEWLDVSYVNFSDARDWVSTIGMLPLLSYFNCSSCSLPLSFGDHHVINSSTSLEMIDLSHNILSSSTNSWLVNSSRNLLELYLSHMTIFGPFPDLFHNMVSLRTLDLSGNRLEQGTFEPIGNLCNLTVLIVSNCGMNQSLTDIVMTMKGCARSSLETLNLGSNDLIGTFPSMSTKFPSLRQLNLSYNQLDSFSPQDSGHLPELRALDISFNDFTNLTTILHHLPSSLEGLYFSSNSFNDVISDTQVSNLTKLKILDLSYNTNLTLNFSKPPFQLQYIGLRSCRLGTSFPNWLLTQKNISSLDISNSNISGSIPAIFWNNLSSSLTYLNLSSNKLSDTVPDLQVLFAVSATTIDLSSNAFYGRVPFFLFSSDELLLSHNHFTSFPPLPCFSNNSSAFSCEWQSFSTFIDLSNNRLSGTFPDCCVLQEYVLGFSVANNRLSGVIPISIGTMSNTHIISLSNNNFSGEIPSSLKNCTKLGLLDLSGNQLTGNIPDWIGESLIHIIALSLRSNKFSGNLPSSLCLLSSLQILDLSHNNLSGNIPSCVYNFTAMAQDVNYSVSQIALVLDAYPPTRSCTQALYSYALFNWKGKDRTFEKELPMLISMDLSNNNLSGEIPMELTSLVKLKSISLSRNNLSGNIPAKIGMLTSLESLNLARNRLSGEIPSSLAEITSLSKLDVSHNNLSGRIPIGTQLQSFGSSAYVVNLGLCGIPLPIKCPGDGELGPQHSVTKASDNRNIKWDMQSFYAASGTGFAFGLLAILGAVNFSRFVNECVNSIVGVVVSVLT